MLPENARHAPRLNYTKALKKAMKKPETEVLYVL